MIKVTWFNWLLLILIAISSFWFSGGPLLGELLLISSIFVVKEVIKNKSWIHYQLTNFMMAYFAWILIVSLFSKLPHLQLLMAPELIALPLGYLIFTQYKIEAELWNKIYQAIVILGVAFSLWAIHQVVNKAGYYGYATGPIDDRNTFAALLNFFLFTAFYQLYKNFKNSVNINYRYLVYIVIAILIISIAFFATKSRGGLLVLVLLILFTVFPLWKSIDSKKSIVLLVLIPTVGYLISTYFLESSVAQRNFDLANDDSVGGRIMLWEATLKMALAHPIVGTGWGTFVSYYPAYRDPLEYSSSGFYTHNDYIQFFLEGGAPALLILLLLFIYTIRVSLLSAQKMRDDKHFEATFLTLSVLSIFMQAFVNYIFYFGFMSLLAGVYLARIVSLTQEAKVVNLKFIERVNPSIIKLIFAFTALIISFPLILHLLALGMFGREQPVYNFLKKVGREPNLYETANIITILRPTEYISQFYILKTNELYLESSKFYQLTLGEQKLFLNSTLELFETVAANMASDANLGVRKVKLLLANKDIYDSGLTKDDQSAYEIAEGTLNKNLQVNKSHAESMIIKAQLMATQGQTEAAKEYLTKCEGLLIGPRDKILVRIALLKLYSKQNQLVELASYEHQLKNMLQFTNQSQQEVRSRASLFKELTFKLKQMEVSFGLHLSELKY